MKKVLFLTSAVLVLASFISGCDGLSSKQRTAADEAMEALRKLGAATQVGVNYQQYGSLAIDAQAQVNAALAVLPEGELKKEMNLAMEAYADAGRVWSSKMKGLPYLDSESEPWKTLIPKYSLRTETSKGDTWTGGESFENSWQVQSKGRVYADSSEALQTIWAVARTHLDKTSSLLQK